MSPDRLLIRVPRVAILCDFIEENWPSMDLVGEMLARSLAGRHSADLHAERVCPPMAPRFSRIAVFGGKRSAHNADRLVNRFWDYPRYVRGLRGGFDLFHIIDHSYSQLIHELDADRTVITCHDLDTFRCVLEPHRDRRSVAFRRMTGHILNGFRKAARITCDSHATRHEVLAHGLVAASRAVVAPNGVHPACTPSADLAADRATVCLLGPSGRHIDLLHVGSTAPRKRIDVLLHVVAKARREFPQIRLLRLGGAFTPEQAALVQQLDLCDSVLILPFLDRAVLAALYRRASLVLQPSEAEGFGLPVAEAMACGTPVIASDLPVLREVGGRAACYCPAGDVPAWSNAVIELLHESSNSPDKWQARCRRSLTQAANFTWEAYAAKMAAIYQELLS